MPPIKAIEQAQFGGVDSRSNPVNMPLQRWIQCRNWRPRPDGHMELREGYMVRVFNQLGPSSLGGGAAGGPAAYSLTPYTVSVPDSYLNPPPPIPAFNPVTGVPPPITQVLPNGTRCALYWQKTAPSQASATVSSVACSIQAAGVPILATYVVSSTARFLIGHSVTVAGVVSNASTPVNFFNGTFPIQAIGGGTITLLLGISTRKPRIPPVPSQPPPVLPPTEVPPSFSLSPGSVNFGNIPANVVSTVSVTVTFHRGNIGGVQPGTIGSTSMSNPAFYVTGLSLPVTGMTDGQSVTFQVNINPSSATSQTGVMLLETSAGTLDITLAADAQAANITVSPTQVVFANTPVGQTSPTQTVTVTNGTGGPVTFYGPPTFSNPDFAITPATDFEPAVTVPDGGSFSFDLYATPSIAGADTGTITFENSDIYFNKILISLEVTGTTVGSGGGGGGGGGGSGSGFPENYAGTGGTITAVETTPGPPVPILIPLTTASGQGFLPDTFPIKGMPIVSTARWHYALGKDGYLYMMNGVDAKFFDGVVFRDIGLPTLTPTQVQAIQVTIGFEGPTSTESTNSAVSWYPGGQTPGGFPMMFYYAFFDLSTNKLAASSTPLGGGSTTPPEGNNYANISGLPTSADPNVVGLLAVNYNGAAGAKFLTADAESPGLRPPFTAAMTGSGTTVTCVSSVPHNLATRAVVAIDQSTPASWPSAGPFGITVLDAYTFSFQVPDATPYNGQSTTFVALLRVESAQTTMSVTALYQLTYQGTASTVTGQLQLPYVENIANSLLPASTIGGAQPGYQFYASIYNPITGHVGNRIPIGQRIANQSDSTIAISGLPDFTQPSAEIQDSQDTGKIPTIPLFTSDPEWRILIGRTGDGGEVPYACIDANGNWITTTAPNQTSLNISTGQIDSNSELPFSNYPPPRSHVKPSAQECFVLFWREGDRLCGVLKDSPFVYRSASELDSTTGIFVGDPAQAWDPSKIETFPTTELIVGGFSNMQESWVYTRDELAQLSELSGQVSWNGPYNNFGIIGSWAFDNGWMALPFWVSHSRELCTMIPDGNGPIVISTEYEKGLLSRIGDEFDAAGNPLGYMEKTEVVYFRDPTRMLEVLRIKCVDNSGNPFTIIHDFNLRDDASPYGQGYEEVFLGPLGIDYQQVYIRDNMALPRIWAAATDGQIYQLYTGGLDNVDYYDGTVGEAFIADAIALRYMGGERTVARTLEWYGDDKILWYIFENMLNVVDDQNYWVNLTFDMRPFPGDAQAAHFIADLQRPEMIHCYLWAQLTAHPVDAPIALDPMALSTPVPHIPLEQYGRLYLTAPWLGGSRGR